MYTRCGFAASKTGFAGFSVAAPGRAWSGLCLIRGSRLTGILLRGSCSLQSGIWPELCFKNRLHRFCRA